MTPRRRRRTRSRGALGLALTLIAVGCRPDQSPPVASAVLREGVDMMLIDMRTFVTREGIRRARVEGDTAEFVGETEIHLRPLTMTFFDEDGRETTRVTADFGVYYELTEDMDAEGSVVALDRVDDQRLETERLRYVSADDRLSSETAFTMWSDGGRTVMKGASFESDPGLDSVRVMTPSGQTEQPLTRTVSPTPAPTGAQSDTAAADTSSTAPDSLGVPTDSTRVGARER